MVPHPTTLEEFEVLASPETTLIGRRYQILNRLGGGGMGELYRAVDRLTGRTVALKRVSPPKKPSGLSSPWDNSAILRLALAHEFRTLASLRHPHVISVLDYGFDVNNQPFFTMELQEDARTILEAGNGQPLPVQISLLVQLMLALAYVHRRGIIHRDLKPSNVLVKDGQVKVLDFGVAGTPEEAETIAGTLAYMAPEVLRGEGATKASDLYAVGVIAFELFAHRRPFVADDPARLIEAITDTEPDFSVMRVDQKVVEVIGRLLEKRPKLRYPDADAVIHALCQASGQPVPQESVLIRESFLQAATFVGREAEIAQLSDALQDVLEGRGSAWLVAGESGVGKSRLLEELRVQALVEGPLMIYGQSVREGGSPYHLWRQALRWMALLTGLSDLEAGVLKAIVPDIGALLERQVPDAPDLEPEAAQVRLLAVIEDVFRRVGLPVVLILEDLQWVGSNSLAILSRLVRAAEGLPLLIVGSYRDDERPGLPDELPGMNNLRLQRLSDKEIATLSEAMLGPAGCQPNVLDLLRHETEGNPFFLVEVIRALAQEAGELSKIGTKMLPMQVFTGGMQRIVRSRLDRIPTEARLLLQAASAVERQVDLNVLGRIAPGVDLESWLTLCANAGVLEVQDGVWRFGHDKLRDALLTEIGADRRPAIHARIASAIESSYPGSADKYAALAHHWKLAGDRAKEGYYAALAGEQALKIGAYKEAIELLKRTLQLDPQTPGSTLTRAHKERLMGEAYNGLGFLKKSRQHAARALEILGWPLPSSTGKMVFGLLRQVALQGLHRLWPNRYLGAGRDRRAELIEATYAYGRILEISHFANETLVTLYASLSTLNLSEAAGPGTPELARAYANMSYATNLIPLRPLSEMYRKRAWDTATAANSLQEMGWVSFVSGFCRTGFGQWAESRREIEQALEIYQRLGDLRTLGIVMAVNSYSPYFRGEFELGVTNYVKLFNESRHRDDLQQQAWALDGQAMHLLRLGRNDQALALLRVADPHFAEITDRFEEILHHGLVGLAILRHGEYELARASVERAAVLIGESQPAAPYALDGYSTVAEVYLNLLEANSRRSARKPLAQSVRRALKDMHNFARVFPVGKPRTMLWQGLYDWLSGHRRKAQNAWQQGLAHAARLNMPYELGLLHYEIGRHLPEGALERRAHLSQACEVFSRLKASYDWALANSALAGG